MLTNVLFCCCCIEFDKIPDKLQKWAQLTYKFQLFKIKKFWFADMFVSFYRSAYAKFYYLEYFDARDI